jgi:ATP-binding cassette, subfamily B, bacterial
MNIVTSGITLLRMTKDTLVAVNRTVMGVDPFYVKITWAGAAISSLRQLGLYSLFGGLVGHLLERVTLDWKTVALGISIYLLYRFAETTLTAILALRKRRFDLVLSDQLEEQMLAKLTSLDLGRLLDPSFNELQRMARHRGLWAVGDLWQKQRELVGSVVALATGSLVLLGLDPIIGVLAVLTAGPMILRDWLVAAKRRELEEAEWLTLRKKLEVSYELTLTNAGLRSRLWKLTEYYHAYFRELAEELINNAMTLARYDRRWNLIVGVVEVCTFAVLCGYFASGFVEGKYSYLQLGAIIGSLSMLVSGVHQFGSSLTQLEQSRLNYEYLTGLLTTQPLIDESRAQDIVLTDTPELLVEDVSFAYPSTGVPVICNCSLIIRPGEKLALVGRNGSGKTTLQRLIAKTYLPSQGSIWIDDHEIHAVRQKSWLNYVVVTIQDLKLPSMEIARALTGEVATDIDKDRMGTALVYSGADDVIIDLAEGIDTWIGEDWPNGRGFSTGQLQRLALAGALYRFLDPKVFIGIFDEPMANCDVETRARFYHSITQAPEFSRKTIIMSLHDPLYLQHFDRVLLLEAGKVAKDLRGHDEIVSYREDIAMTLAGDL